MTADQIAILLLGWVAAAGIVTAYYAATVRDLGGRHVAGPPAPRPDPDEPATAPVPLAERLTISFPAPRTYSGGIPLLHVDSPPGAHGHQPATDLPVARTWACSLCHDGTLTFGISRTGICVWCGQPAVNP